MYILLLSDLYVEFGVDWGSSFSLDSRGPNFNHPLSRYSPRSPKRNHSLKNLGQMGRTVPPSLIVQMLTWLDGWLLKLVQNRWYQGLSKFVEAKALQNSSKPTKPCPNPLMSAKASQICRSLPRLVETRWYQDLSNPMYNTGYIDLMTWWYAGTKHGTKLRTGALEV